MHRHLGRFVTKARKLESMKQHISVYTYLRTYKPPHAPGYLLIWLEAQGSVSVHEAKQAIEVLFLAKGCSA